MQCMCLRTCGEIYHSPPHVLYCSVICCGATWRCHAQFHDIPRLQDTSTNSTCCSSCRTTYETWRSKQRLWNIAIESFNHRAKKKWVSGAGETPTENCRVQLAPTQTPRVKPEGLHGAPLHGENRRICPEPKQTAWNMTQRETGSVADVQRYFLALEPQPQPWPQHGAHHRWREKTGGA